MIAPRAHCDDVAKLRYDAVAAFSRLRFVPVTHQSVEDSGNCLVNAFRYLPSERYLADHMTARLVNHG